MPHYQLDVRGLHCPIPVIKTDRKSKELQAGDILTVLGTDPTIIEDIPAWCHGRGHSVLEIKRVENEITITLQVASSIDKK